MTTAEAEVVRPIVEQAAPRAAASAAHVPEIDWLKGFAILCVIGIHAKVYEASPIHEYVINRAVPIFTVLFGVTSELWWRRMTTVSTGERLRAWYGGRLRRIYLPVWAFAAAWWLVVILTNNAARFGFGPARVIESLAGYSPWNGTSWFVALLIQAVLLYPVLRWVFARLGVLLLPVTLWGCWWCGMHLLPIVSVARFILGDALPAPGFYAYWVFLPRVFAQIATGFLIARRWSGRPPLWATVSAALLSCAFVALILLASRESDPLNNNLHHQILFYYFDIPLTVALLGASRFLRRFTLFTRFLAWCGLSSWGIYLGHTLIYELLHGLTPMAPETGPNSVRLVFWLFLFGCGVVSTAVGDRLRRIATVTRAR